MSFSRSSATMGRSTTRLPSLSFPSFSYASTMIPSRRRSHPCRQSFCQIVREAGLTDLGLSEPQIVRYQSELDGGWVGGEDEVGRLPVMIPRLPHATGVDEIHLFAVQRHGSPRDGETLDFPPHVPLPDGAMVSVSKESDPHFRYPVAHVSEGLLRLEKIEDVGLRIVRRPVEEDEAIPEKQGVGEAGQKILVFRVQGARRPEHRLMGEDVEALGKARPDCGPVVVPLETDHLMPPRQIHALPRAGVVSHQVPQVNDG